jgi:hypothetical protein
MGQPLREKNMEQLQTEIKNNASVDLILYPEGYLQEIHLNQLCELAETYRTSIVIGYKNEQKLDRALIINNKGKVILERVKSPENAGLNTPSVVTENEITFGFLLCREVFVGFDSFKHEKSCDVIFNPIGVGMFSEEQYSDWSGEAKRIAVQHNAWVLGTSHADGSYRNCGISIPIAYCFDGDGKAILLSKDDTRTRIIDTVTKTVETIENPVKIN